MRLASCDSQPRLAAAAGPGQRQQPVVLEQTPSLGELVVPAHEARPRSRQPTSCFPHARRRSAIGGHRRPTPREHGRAPPEALSTRTSLPRQDAWAPPSSSMSRAQLARPHGLTQTWQGSDRRRPHKRLQEPPGPPTLGGGDRIIGSATRRSATRASCRAPRYNADYGSARQATRRYGGRQYVPGTDSATVPKAGSTQACSRARLGWLVLVIDELGYPIRGEPVGLRTNGDSRQTNVEQQSNCGWPVNG